MKNNKHVEEILNEQLPAYFRPVIEFQEIIKAYGFALEQLENAYINVQDNLYIVSCDGQTLSWYETLLGITKSRGLSLEERRAVVLMQYGMRSRYTLVALKELLAGAVGEENYSVECRHGKYQLVIKIIGQDIYLVKELYNMVFRMNPAHIMLVLYAEYREVTKVEVKPSLSITFIMAFYPLFNLPKLQLNARWKLNGKKKLSSYDSSGKTDLYPVEMEIQVPVHEAPGEAAQIHFLLGAQEQTESGQEMEVLTLAACQGKVKEEFTLQTTAKTQVKAGNATLYNAHRLDGKRKLNGSLKLNGGVYEL